MQAVRHLDEPYPLHGSEVAIRYCSPNNRASRLSPEAFAQYLREPWYRIMAEWDEIEVSHCSPSIPSHPTQNTHVTRLLARFSPLPLYLHRSRLTLVWMVADR